MSNIQKVLDALDKTQVTPSEFLKGAVEHVATYALYKMAEEGNNAVFWTMEAGDKTITLEVRRLKNELPTTGS